MTTSKNEDLLLEIDIFYHIKPLFSRDGTVRKAKKMRKK